MRIFGIIVPCFFIQIFVMADKSSILLDDSKKDWISLENFARMIRFSLNSSKCTNIYLAENSVEIGKVFGYFVKIYPYAYTINDRIYWCNGYMTISTSDEQVVKRLARVPNKISTIELLIIVINKTEESSRLFNESLYGNANVNIATGNGLWSLSENFLAPRTFKKISEYESMIHKQGIVDLNGRRLQVAAFYYPPLCYLDTTINRTIDGIEAEIFIENKAQFELDGIETKIFLLLADQLNFTWTIRKPNGDYRYGRRNGSSWYGGMIGQMFRQEIDLAFTGIWLDLDHYTFTNLSYPWSNFDIHFLVPRPKPYTSFWALTRPLSPQVWATVLTMIIVQSIYVYVKARINRRVPKRFQSFATTWAEVMARLVGISAPRNIRGLKLQLLLWHLIGVLIVTSYSSSLEASLASSRYEERIDTTEQFIRANLSWGREGPIPKFEEYFGNLDPWAMKFASRFEHEKSEEERHEKILNGKYAIIGRIVGSIFFPENTIREEDLKGYRLMRDSIGHFYSSFAVQPWLINSVDKVMLRLAEAGLIVYHLRDVLHRRTTNAIYGVLIERDGVEGGAVELDVTPFGAGFLMLALGSLLSSVIFYFELKSVAKKKSIIQIFREINKKHQISKNRKTLCRLKKGNF